MCWLQVRQAGGTLVLRMEDVDEQRSKTEFAEALMRDLQWLGLTWDEGPDRGGPAGPYMQQERYALYDGALSALQRGGLLYPCYCSRARLQAIGAPHAGERSVYDGHCYGMTVAERAAMKKDPSWRVHVPRSRRVVLRRRVWPAGGVFAGGPAAILSYVVPTACTLISWPCPLTTG